MPVVDSHCHVSLSWYEPVEVLLFQMDRNGVDRAVLIQMMGQSNNEYQLQCVLAHPDRLASVAIVDTASRDAPRQLERLREEGHVGVRFRADTRSPEDDPLGIWRTAERLGLAVSCGGGAALFASDDFARLVQEHPGLPIVIEHLGSLNRPDDAERDELRRKVLGLARFPNTYIKLHGLGEFASRAMPAKEPIPFVEPIPSLIEQAYEAFGARRMMWGSDYPPVSGREGYRNALRLPMDRLSHLPKAESDEVFGGTAGRVFPLRK